MDLTYIPDCALCRSAGTVLTYNMDSKCDLLNCCRGCDIDNDMVGGLTICEPCSRTRFVYSKLNGGCASGIVGIRHRKSIARSSRYVNVCAAVCLLLLVGGLLPRSSAAPHWLRAMDRQRREGTPGENKLWGNPCDYDSTPSNDVPYDPRFADAVAVQARNALHNTEKFKDIFAMKLHSYEHFEELISTWSGEEWLKEVSWTNNVAPPKSKFIHQDVPSSEIDSLLNNIDAHLPTMFKALKYLIAAMNTLEESLGTVIVVNDNELREKIRNSKLAIRSVLCTFYDLMKARKLEIPTLMDHEFEPVKDVLGAFLAYRDTISYLEFLQQLFEKMALVVK